MLFFLFLLISLLLEILLIWMVFQTVSLFSFVLLACQENYKNNWKTKQEKKNNVTSQKIVSLKSFQKKKNHCHLPVLPSYLHCGILYKYWQNIDIWILPLPPCSPLVFSHSYCLTIVRCRHRGSCTTNIRNSVNFTLCCLPKNPGPRFGDLASKVSFQSFPRLPPTQDPVLAASLFGCISQKHLEVSGYGSIQTSRNKLRSVALCNLHCVQRSSEETNYKTWLKRKSSKKMIGKKNQSNTEPRV